MLGRAGIMGSLDVPVIHKNDRRQAVRLHQNTTTTNAPKKKKKKRKEDITIAAARKGKNLHQGKCHLII
jgi:hypothetical protein